MLSVGLLTDAALLAIIHLHNANGAKTMTRKYTNMLLDMLDEGIISHDEVIMACLKYLSEDDVQDMMEANEFIEEVYEDEENVDIELNDGIDCINE
jgi:hypothetical protein